MAKVNASELSGYARYEYLRDLVLAKPSRVIEEGQHALGSVHPYLIPRLLSVVGSALRRTADLNASWEAFVRADRMARKLPDSWAEADNFQRWGHLVKDRGDYEGALNMAEKATAIFTRLQDQIGFGRAIFDQGLWLSHLGRFEEAIGAYQVALKMLPSSQKSSIFGCLQNLAMVHLEMGDVEKSLKYASELETRSADVAPLIMIFAIDYQGRLQLRSKEYSDACLSFGKVFDFCLENDYHFEAAVAAIPLCQTLILSGESTAALIVAERSASLIGHLKGNRLAQGAMTVLATEAAAGRQLSLKKLDDLRKTMALAQEQHEAMV